MLRHQAVVLIGVAWLAWCTVHGNRYVARVPTGLAAMGHPDYYDLGELVGAQMVASEAECGQLCEGTEACRSVMLMREQGLCRMFSNGLPTCPKCPSEFSAIPNRDGSRYLVGLDETIKGFVNTQTHCNSLGGHLVHINSLAEHQAVVAFIQNTVTELGCSFVWTGGWKHSLDNTDWRWHFTSDTAAGNYTSFTDEEYNLIPWDTGYRDTQLALVLDATTSYRFNDFSATYSLAICFVCECSL